MLKIGIIGGSGLDDPDILKDPKQLDVTTEYGDPSSPLLSGKINDVEIVILARHGRRHRYSPTQVNNRANIKAFQQVGVT
ncbi:MAG: S-methyl-5'-thioadenosine phosphorylase, partial [Proteobacteria bacterium]|nr:S-methyl-5'-thioadenosine phosphorylase [Pseudomonadota bacterium]